MKTKRDLLIKQENFGEEKLSLYRGCVSATLMAIADAFETSVADDASLANAVLLEDGELYVAQSQLLV